MKGLWVLFPKTTHPNVNNQPGQCSCCWFMTFKDDYLLRCVSIDEHAFSSTAADVSVSSVSAQWRLNRICDREICTSPQSDGGRLRLGGVWRGDINSPTFSTLAGNRIDWMGLSVSSSSSVSPPLKPFTHLMVFRRNFLLSPLTRTHPGPK